ncbi:hypothetical protein EJB05_25688, partial [Eragrostis curvula]
MALQRRSPLVATSLSCSFLLLLLFFPSQTTANKTGQLTVFWGRNKTEGSLKEACDTGLYTTVIISYLSAFGHGKYNLDIAGHDASAVGADVKHCQSKHILLASGNPSPIISWRPQEWTLRTPQKGHVHTRRASSSSSTQQSVTNMATFKRLSSPLHLLLPILLVVLLLGNVGSPAAAGKTGQLTVFWGRNKDEGSLREACDTGLYTTVIISFLSVFGHGKHTLDISGHDASAVGADVTHCQRAKNVT